MVFFNPDPVGATMTGGQVLLCAVAAAAGQVDCGGHTAAACSLCPTTDCITGDCGQKWCNGVCAWVSVASGDGFCKAMPAVRTAAPTTPAMLGKGITPLHPSHPSTPANATPQACTTDMR